MFYKIDNRYLNYCSNCEIASAEKAQNVKDKCIRLWTAYSYRSQRTGFFAWLLKRRPNCAEQIGFLFSNNHNLTELLLKKHPTIGKISMKAALIYFAIVTKESFKDIDYKIKTSEQLIYKNNEEIARLLSRILKIESLCAKQNDKRRR